MHVVAIGNAFEGINLIGPFFDVDEANDYMKEQGEYIVLELGMIPNSHIAKLLTNASDALDEAANFLSDDNITPSESSLSVADKLTVLACECRWWKENACD